MTIILWPLRNIQTRQKNESLSQYLLRNKQKTMEKKETHRKKKEMKENNPVTETRKLRREKRKI